MGQLRQLLCLFFLFPAGFSHPAYSQSPAAPRQKDAPQQPTPPQPTLTVSFERSSLEIGDSMQVVLQLVNNSPIALSAIRVVVDAPEFIQLQDRQGPVPGTIDLPDLQPFSAIYRRQVIARVLAKGQVGDFNLVFTLSYKWTANKEQHESLMVQEKPLKIGLFGTDKIIGIPLAFAQFVVPGLFFLFILRIFKVSGGKDQGTDEKIIISVLISVLCLFMVYLYRGLATGKWSDRVDPGNTISVGRLFFLALAGALLGLAVVAGWYARQEYIRRKKNALAFTGDETNARLLWKALQLNPKYEGFPWQFTAKDGTVFIGSHYFETEFSYVLLGSFGIDIQYLKGNDGEKFKKYSKVDKIIQTTDGLLAILQLLGGEKTAQLTVHNAIKKVTEKGTEDAGIFYTIDKEEYRSRTHVRENAMHLLDWE